MDARNYAESFILEMDFFFFLNKEELKCFKITCFTFSSRCQIPALEETVLRSGRGIHAVSFSFHFPFSSSKAEKKKFKRD